LRSKQRGFSWTLLVANAYTQEAIPGHQYPPCMISKAKQLLQPLPIYHASAERHVLPVSTNNPSPLFSDYTRPVRLLFRWKSLFSKLVICLYPCKTEKKKERKKDLAAAPHHVWQKLDKHCREISSWVKIKLAPGHDARFCPRSS
jgi:hypothetical protein